MPPFAHGSITEIPTDKPDVHAFSIAGHVEDDDMEALAEYMNHMFDKPGKVSLLLDLSTMTGRDLDGLLDGDVLKAQFRSWSALEKYAVIGVPDRAARMIDWMDKVMPVDARAFDAADAHLAWSFVGARARPAQDPD